MPLQTNKHIWHSRQAGEKSRKRLKAVTSIQMHLFRRISVGGASGCQRLGCRFEPYRRSQIFRRSPKPLRWGKSVLFFAKVSFMVPEHAGMDTHAHVSQPCTSGTDSQARCLLRNTPDVGRAAVSPQHSNLFSTGLSHRDYPRPSRQPYRSGALRRPEIGRRQPTEALQVEKNERTDTCC